MVVPSETLRRVELLSMTGNDSAAFSGKVAASRGIIPVHIHPRFLDGAPAYEILEEYKEYKRKRDSAIATSLIRGEPIVIFEERDPYRPLPRGIVGTSKGTLYVVQGEPKPVEGSWDDVHDVLRNAQVNEIQIGGTFSDKCMNEAAEEFAAHGFRVTRTLPLFSYPF